MKTTKINKTILFNNYQQAIPKLRDLTVEKVQDLAKQYLILKNLSNNPDLTTTALSRGVWYSTEYRKTYLQHMPHLTPSDLQYISKIAYPKKCSDGYANAEYFTQVAPLIWRIKPSVSASEALDKALEGPTLTDCGGVCNLARCYALREVLGKEKFDILFKGRLILGYPPDDYLDYFFQPSKHLHKGNLVSFKNHRLYPLKHPFGMYQGSNMIAKGDGKYIGLGTSHKGLTGEEISQFLADEFNKPIDRRLSGTVSEEEFEEFLDLYKLSESAFLEGDVQINLKDVPGLYTIQDFDVDRIRRVLELDPKKITSPVIDRIFPEWKVVDRHFAKTHS